ncbi:hypothetical protein ACWDE0_34460 [Streptomyces sp. 900105755]
MHGGAVVAPADERVPAGVPLVGDEQGHVPAGRHARRLGGGQPAVPGDPVGRPGRSGQVQGVPEQDLVGGQDREAEFLFEGVDDAHRGA